MMETLSIQQVADRYYELNSKGKGDKIQDELYSLDCISIEPDNDFLPQKVVGLEAIKQKGKIFEDMIEEVHSTFCNKPIVAESYFACTMGMDATMKGEGRMIMEEIALFHVKDGKIISEEFFG